MRNSIYIFLLFFPAVLFGQVVKTAAVPYTKGAGYTPNIASSSELRVDTAASALYWWDRDNLTWIRFRPGVDVITGSSAPAYTPRDNQSLFAVNADGELYYYNSPSWVKIGGAGGGGIYGGSGTTGAPLTAVTVDSIISFSTTDANGRFIANVAGGSDVSGILAVDTFTRIYYDDPGGTNLVEPNNEGISLTTIASDRVTITGNDARYANNYSALYSARSLVDKGYVDSTSTAGISIPDGEIAYGNATSDGLTSSSTLTYDGDVLTNDNINLEGSSGTITGKDATLQDLGASGSASGGTLTIANFDGAALTSAHRMGLLQFSGNTGVGSTGIGASIQGFAGATWTGTSSPGELRIFTTPSGTLTEKERVRITRTGVTQLRNGGFLDFYNAADAATMEMGVTDSILYIYGLGAQEESEFAFQGKIGLLRSGSLALTGNVNNLYLGCGGGVVDIGSNGAYNITGMQANIGASSARLLFAVNTGNYTITLVDESASSLAANRFDLDGVNYSWAAGEVLMLLYEDSRDRWTIPNRSRGGDILNGGNTTAAAVVIGTNDANALSFETNNVVRATITGGASTGGAVTITDVTSNTNSIETNYTSIVNSSGTAATSFGMRHLMQLESSTTDAQDAAAVNVLWSNATHATRTADYVIQTAINGTLTEIARFNGTTTPKMVIGTSGASYFANSINAGSGTFSISSSSTGSATAIVLNATGNNTNASGTLGGNTFTTTSGTKYDWRLPSSFAPTSGTGLFYTLRINPTIDQTGGANGLTGAIIFDPTLTAVGASWSALTMTTSNSAAKMINQTGANTTSTHVGAFGFGSTTIPTDKVEVTGNLALLTAGNKIKIATGSNASAGQSAAMTAGTITINTTAVTANSLIFLTHASVGGTQGILSVGTITAGTSFVINSSNAADTGTVNWWIIN